VTWDVALGYFTGLRLLNPTMEAAVLLRTALVVHTCDAVMCRLFAHNNGYPKNLCTLLGFVFGVWALGVLILLPKRSAPAPSTRTEGGKTRGGEANRGST
jgi:hypothetical protein